MLRRTTAPPPPFRDLLRDGTNRQRLDLILGRDGLADAEHRDLLAAAPGWGRLFRLIWRHPDPAVKVSGLGFAADAGALAEGPAALERLGDDCPTVRSAAAAALVALADRVDAAVRAGEGDEPGRRAFVAALAAHVAAGKPRAKAAAGWLLVAAAAGDREPAALAENPAGEPLLAEALASDRHPGAVRALLGLLALRRPPRCAVAAAGRTDAAFLVPLLGTVARSGSAALPGLPALPWLAEPGPVLAGLPPGLQPAVAALANRTCEPGGSRRAVRSWLIRGGTAAGRRAAEPVLRELPADARWAVLTDAAASPDPAVAAWAAGLFVAHRVPGWPRRLLALAGHADGAVRAAAAAALRDAADAAGGRLTSVRPTPAGRR